MAFQSLHLGCIRLHRPLNISRGFITSVASSSATSTTPNPAPSRRRLHKSRRQVAAKSLGSQADNDLVKDTAMAKSAKDYQRRHRSGAPTLPISSGTRDDLPHFVRSKRIRKIHTEGLTSAESSSTAHALPSLDRSETSPMNPQHTIGATPAQVDTGTISAQEVTINGEYQIFVSELIECRNQTSTRNEDSPFTQVFKQGLVQDEELLDLAQRHHCKFIGSTSTLTKALSQIYFAISGGKGVDLSTLSQDFSSERTTFTPGAELPASIVIDQLPHDIYSVDSDKRWDIENVISDFGRILEKMLTCEAHDFQRFLTSSPESAVPEEERTAKEAYRYKNLDCYDPRLPGHGVFDIKTRACLPIRYDRANYQANAAYDVWKDRGYNESYEREYYDFLQVRIGGMDGIFLAYHNTSRLFGFQYISLSEIDERIFGSTEMADQAFKLSVTLLEQLLHKCVAVFPEQAINVILKHSPAVHPHSVTAYVEPKQWDGLHGERPIRAITFTMENMVDNEAIQGPVAFSVDEKVRQTQNWSINYNVSYNTEDEEGIKKARDGLKRLQQDLLAMNHLTVPHGETVKSMTRKDDLARREKKAGQNSAENAVDNVEELTKIRWREPGSRQVQLRVEAQESGRAYQQRKKTWKAGRYAWTTRDLIPSTS
ncbi:uncharacterized protein L201_001251 [Kwoniella dendrophila CBS 6074]|uniref:Uncharacterized protein n=1 Tax=Kwoniella dendrophila CBS 6074 TaxID=1295534 RepID=A0AAX4JP91_9TREE